MMDSDDKMLATVGVAIFAMFSVLMVAAAWVRVEQSRTERAAIEHGCPTPAMSDSSHEE